MAKFVQFDVGTDEPTFYEVEDFSLETIRKLPLYKNTWLRMSFLDGEKRMFDGKILDIYPSELVSMIYYGKKVSYDEVKQIVEDDLSYKDLLRDMYIRFEDSFCNLNLKFKDDDDYKKQYETYKEKFYKTHYCLFTLPNNFSTYPLSSAKSITIEDFDSDVKLDYSSVLNNIKFNASMGKDYFKENESALYLFKNYFEMLQKICKNSTIDDRKLLFGVLRFHFECIANLQTIDEINFFLDISNYVYKFSNTNREVFNQYKSFINEQYKYLGNNSNLGSY